MLTLFVISRAHTHTNEQTNKAYKRLPNVFYYPYRNIKQFLWKQGNDSSTQKMNRINQNFLSPVCSSLCVFLYFFLISLSGDLFNSYLFSFLFPSILFLAQSQALSKHSAMKLWAACNYKMGAATVLYSYEPFSIEFYVHFFWFLYSRSPLCVCATKNDYRINFHLIPNEFFLLLLL